MFSEYKKVSILEDDVVDAVNALISKVDIKDDFEEYADGDFRDDKLVAEYIKDLIAEMPIEVAVYEDEEVFIDSGYADKFEQVTETHTRYYHLHDYLYGNPRNKDIAEEVENLIKLHLGV